jgi:Rps23 Pro-64 3,4-dihydroxylase Tpa1-like proline 4-hydroxylase
LKWFEADAPWALRIADFYEQYEFSLQDAELPPALKDAFSEAEIAELNKHVENVFDVGLRDRVDITAHKLSEGQRIRIHNDFIPGQESHRLLVQLNRGWPDANGGALVLFSDDDPSAIHRILRPVHNSGLLFEISPRSFHAVTPIKQGERYTLVFSFFRECS